MANKTLFWSFYVSFCTFCASLRLIKHLFSRLPNKAISMAMWTKATLCFKSSLLEQSLPRTPSRPKTSIISVNPVILSNFSSCLCAFCAFLWLKKPFNQRNQLLINDLRACKALYNCRDASTDVMSALQIRLFMQNKAKFRKVKLNVNKVLTKDYDKRTLGQVGKTNPKRTQSKPISKAKMLLRLAICVFT